MPGSVDAGIVGTLVRSRLPIGTGGVPVTLGVETLKRTGTPISPRLFAVAGRVAPIRGGVLDGLLADHCSDLLFGLLGGLVAVRGVVVAQLRCMVSLISRAVPTLGSLIPFVGGLISLVGGAVAAISGTVRRCLIPANH